MAPPRTSLLLAWLIAGVSSTTQAVPLPTQFEGDLVYVIPRVGESETLRLYTDTGGGYFLSSEAVARLKLDAQPAPPELQQEMGPLARLARLPASLPESDLPRGLGLDGAIPVMPDRSGGILPGANPMDGMLGAPWFGGRIWTWDFAGRRLIHEASDWTATAGMQRVPLHFKQAPDGRRVTHFPRIAVRIDGRELPMLLDTGAMTVLAPEALQTLDDGAPAQRATSMIADNVFQAWRSAHPEWRVIEKAQAGTGSAMIEVPEVEIAGHLVGPVWFTHRPDRNFHEFMSGMMDARVEGAVGNNVFRHFRMTIDYPGASAWFSCAAECRTAR